MMGVIADLFNAVVEVTFNEQYAVKFSKLLWYVELPVCFNNLMLILPKSVMTSMTEWCFWLAITNTSSM